VPQGGQPRSSPESYSLANGIAVHVHINERPEYAGRAFGGPRAHQGISDPPRPGERSFRHLGSTGMRSDAGGTPAAPRSPPERLPAFPPMRRISGEPSQIAKRQGCQVVTENWHASDAKGRDIDQMRKDASKRRSQARGG
jgi:hypothetical protein